MVRLFLLALLLAFSSPARAQLPPPVDLGIQNIAQETAVWCWAAVAQQIVLRAMGPARTPPQCAMVAIANGAPPWACCNGNPQCHVTGSLPQIQGLIAHFGGRYSSLAPPTDPMTLYQTLANGRPIIMAVQSSPYAGHVVVLRGMYFVPTPMGVEPMLLINDPMSFFTQPIPYRQVLGYWQAAIVVQ
jgi:hypothetical protein